MHCFQKVTAKSIHENKEEAKDAEVNVAYRSHLFSLDLDSFCKTCKSQGNHFSLVINKRCSTQQNFKTHNKFNFMQ